MTTIEDLNYIDNIITEVIAEGGKDLGMVLIRVTHDGSHNVNSTYTELETLNVLVGTVHSTVKGMIDKIK